MPDDDELARRVRKLVVEHAETRWLALRVDEDIQEIRRDLREVRDTQRTHTLVLNEHTDLLNDHSDTLQEHLARFDSVDSQLRSLTQMVGQVLQRFDERS